MCSTKLPFVLLSMVLAMPVQAQLGLFTINEPVPDLVLPDAHDGQPRSLAEFRGERYILHVFASW